MRYSRHEERYLIRLESGERVMETLVAFAREEGLLFAQVQAIGAVSEARLAYWNAQTREYEYTDVSEQTEIVGFSGNLAWREGEPFFHVHVMLGRQDLSVLGGHLVEATVNPTLEVILSGTLSGSVDKDESREAPVRRKDEQSGLFLLDLPE
jgi:uncharacterized protein